MKVWFLVSVIDRLGTLLVYLSKYQERHIKSFSFSGGVLFFFSHTSSSQRIADNADRS